MKKLFLITSVFYMVLSFTSCEEDLVPMMWEFSSYDTDAMSATYAPDYVYQISISANDDFSGEVTLTCTNYSNITLDANTNDGSIINEEAGVTITQIDDRTLMVIFTPISNLEEGDISTIVSVNGNNNKKRNITNIHIVRRHEKE